MAFVKMKYSKRLYQVIAILLCGLVVSFLTASLVLAKRDASVYPGNLYAGPIYLGNMTRAEALDKLQDDNTAASLSIDCIIGQDIYTLKLKDLGIKMDAPATINKIDSQIGEWSLVSHSLNRGKKLVVTPVWEFDYDRLQQSLNNLALSKNKEPVDARVVLVGNYLLHLGEQYGAQIVPDLAVDLITEILNEGKLKVILGEKPIPPAITRSQIMPIEELLSVQAVPGSSKDQEVSDTSWAVPGKIILPGDSIPIGIMVDAHAEDGQYIVAKWQEALSTAAREAGLVYEAADQELFNPTDQPAALFITQEEEMGLIRIYGQQNPSGSRITISRSYRPLLTPSAVAWNQEENRAGEKIYRHKFVRSQLQATEQLEFIADAVPGMNSSSNGFTNYK